MGIMGPAIKVEVGDTLEIIFKNKASRQYSFNPFGLDVTKENEGALYRNNRHSKLFILYLPPVKSTEKNTNIPRNVYLTTLKWNETKIYICLPFTFTIWNKPNYLGGFVSPRYYESIH